MRPFDRDLPPLLRRAAPPDAPLREVAYAMFELRDLDRLGAPSFEEADVEATFRRYGAPPAPLRGWWLEAPCGLSFALAQDFLDASVLVQAEEVAEVDHVLAHLPFPPGEVHRLAPAPDERARRTGGGWFVVRTDTHGLRADVAGFTRERSASCHAQLLERRGHKQAYDVEPREPLPAPPSAAPAQRARWVLVRQDDNGVRVEVRRASDREGLEWLADRLGREPRHKMTWTVEPLGPLPAPPEELFG